MNRRDCLDELPYTISIYTMTAGGFDNRGNPLPATKEYKLQDAKADFQPLTGTMRTAATGSAFESTHKIFVFDQDVINKGIKEGMKVEVNRNGNKVGNFIITFVEDYILHFEAEVKRDD